MAHSYVRHDSFICATWRIHMCDMTHSYVRHGAFICATWLIHMCDMAHSYVRHDAFTSATPWFTCATWLIHMCEMTHSYVRHDSFICATWRIHMCDMTHSPGRHNWFICATWLFHMCDMTHSFDTIPVHVPIEHDAFVCATWLFHMCDTTYSYVRHDSLICATWRIPATQFLYMCQFDMNKVQANVESVQSVTFWFFWLLLIGWRRPGYWNLGTHISARGGLYTFHFPLSTFPSPHSPECVRSYFHTKGSCGILWVCRSCKESHANACPLSWNWK